MPHSESLPPLGWRLLRFDTLDSTNRRALEFKSDQPLHGCVFLAAEQSKGRGRQGRAWFSGRKLGLYTSILFTNGLQGVPTQLLSIMVAVSIYDVLKDMLAATAAKIDIKWPNDILVNGRKICGILGEMRSGEPGAERIVIGFSINIHHRLTDFPKELQDRATSLRMLGLNLDESAREQILSRILTRANLHFDRLRGEGGEHLIKRLTMDSTIVSGKRLRIATNENEEITGTSCGLNEDGSLQFRLDSGLEIPLYAGEVHLLND